MIFVRDIQAATAEHYGIPLEAMHRPFGAWKTEAHPRQVAMCLAMRLTNQGPTRIGRVFGGRDHTTVLHAMHRTERRPEAKEPMRQITKLLLQAEGRL